MSQSNELGENITNLDSTEFIINELINTIYIESIQKSKMGIVHVAKCTSVIVI